MSKTYRSPRLNPECKIPAGRVVKESGMRRFVKAVRRLSHHQERHLVRSALRTPDSALQLGEAL